MKIPPIPQIPIDIQIGLTRAFVAADPVTISLTPRTLVPDGEGGSVRTPQTPRAPQVFTLIEPGNSGFQQPISDDTGEQYTIEFMLLGDPDVVMERNDVFTYENQDYQIREIMPFNGYERRAVVIRHAW